MLRRLNWLLMLATLAAAFALYAVKYDTRRLEARVQAQERALEKAENDVAILMAERTHLARPERLEPLARLIGLAPVTPAQYLREVRGEMRKVAWPTWPEARQLTLLVLAVMVAMGLILGVTDAGARLLLNLILGFS